MGVLTLAEQLDLALLEAQDPSMAIRGEEMAGRVFENATAFLNGEREDFFASFCLTQGVHRIAVSELDGKLALSEYGKSARALGRYAMFPDSRDEHFGYLISKNLVAEYGGRCIIAKQMSDYDHARNRIITSDVHYEPLKLK